jgi:hypothetical protein
MLPTDLEVYRMYCYNEDKITADDVLCSEDDNDSATEHTDDIVIQVAMYLKFKLCI